MAPPRSPADRSRSPVAADSIARSAAAGRSGSGACRRRWCSASSPDRSPRASRRGRSRWSARGSTCCRCSSRRARNRRASSRTIIRAVRRQTSANQATYVSTDGVSPAASSSGKSLRIVKSARRFSNSTSPRAARISKLPKRTNDGATRQTTAPGSGGRMAVVEHVAHHLLAGRDQAERARGRHAEVMHRLAAQEFAHRRAQHRAAVGGARVRGWARAFQLQLPALAARVDDFAERDRATVAELPGPVAELMAAVNASRTAACRRAGDCRRTLRRTRVSAANRSPSAAGRAVARLRASTRPAAARATGVGNTRE